MAGITRDEKHKVEQKMKLVALDIGELLSYFDIKKDFEKVLLINKIKNNLDSIFLDFEKAFTKKDLKDILDG
jgi:hypothetical protein